MKRTLIAALVCAGLPLVAACGQGTFQNLDFEAARVILLPNTRYPLIATSNALPGWSAFFIVPGFSTNPVPWVVLDNENPTVVDALSLLDAKGGALDGNFSLSLGSYSISQTGLVPGAASSLRFESTAPDPSALSVSLGGQRLQCVVLSSGVNYTVYSADVSAFAGQSATLRFASAGIIDDIEFSPQIVPEPSVLALAAAAASLLLCRRNRSQRPAQVGRG